MTYGSCFYIDTHMVFPLIHTVWVSKSFRLQMLVSSMDWWRRVAFFMSFSMPWIVGKVTKRRRAEQVVEQQEASSLNSLHAKSPPQISGTWILILPISLWILPFVFIVLWHVTFDGYKSNYMKLHTNDLFTSPIFKCPSLLKWLQFEIQ